MPAAAHSAQRASALGASTLHRWSLPRESDFAIQCRTHPQIGLNPRSLLLMAIEPEVNAESSNWRLLATGEFLTQCDVRLPRLWVSALGSSAAER